MNRWRVGEDRGCKEMDRCPLAAGDKVQQDNATIVHTPHTYDGNLDDRGKDRDNNTTPITCKHERGLWEDVRW
jgi:hypothetical protein